MTKSRPELSRIEAPKYFLKQLLKIKDETTSLLGVQHASVGYLLTQTEVSTPRLKMENYLVLILKLFDILSGPLYKK